MPCHSNFLFYQIAFNHSPLCSWSKAQNSALQPTLISNKVLGSKASIPRSPTLRLHWQATSLIAIKTALPSEQASWFGGYELGNTPFAVATTGNITFPPRGSGILGLSFYPGNSQLQLSSNGIEVGAEEASFTIPFVEQLWRLNALKQPLFSFNMILDEHDKNATDESPGGHLLLGGVDESLYEGEIVYSSLLVDQSLSSDYRRATIQGVSFNGKLLPESGFDASFDTGTGVSQLPFSIISDILSQ